MGLDKIGALWAKEKNGKRFLSGEIELVRGGEKIRVLVFKNEDKEGKQPDYRIMRQVEDIDEPRRESKRQEPVIQRGREIDDEDLPF